jgi:hypothetical protein
MLSARTVPFHAPQVYLRPRRRGCFSLDAHTSAHPSASEQSTIQQSLKNTSTARSGTEVRASAVHEASLAFNLTPSVDAVNVAQVAPAFEAPTHHKRDCAHGSPEQDASDRLDEILSPHPPRKSSGSALREISALAIPALAVCLADPVCSMVDTACVGQVSSLQLASLSPCTAIFNLVFLVCISYPSRHEDRGSAVYEFNDVPTRSSIFICGGHF